MATEPTSLPAGNRFDRMEWAGAFGDLGTLLPFVIAYIAILKMDAAAILFSIGVLQIACGTYYRTPFPVQPMKAIGAAAATQAAQTATITPEAVHWAGLATGLIWLLLGVTGAVRSIARWVPKCVITGIVLGLGFSFMLQGIRMMEQGWWIAVTGLIGTLLLMSNRHIPAMFVLLLFGTACGLWMHPELLQSLAAIRPQVRIPELHPFAGSVGDILLGIFVLALPQLPLTLGNAVIAIHDENNRLFPERCVTETGVAKSTGLMNLTSFALGGIPVCHGAGGMAGHVAFGARTGGAPIILGAILLILAVGFGDSITTIFSILPQAVLGVILFLTGSQLALGSNDIGSEKVEKLITLMVAGLSIWNVAAGFVAGLSLSALRQYGRLKV